MPDPENPSSPDRRKAVIGVVVALAVVVVVFGIVFPSLVDWDQVADALERVDGADVVALVVLGIAMYLPAGWLYAICLPGLTLGQGTQAWVASTAVATTLPGFDLVLRISMYTSWGHPVERSTLGMLLSGLVEMTTKVTLAVVALAVWAGWTADLELLALVGIAAAVLVAVLVGVALLLRSERTAGRFGERLQVVLTRLFRRLRREAPADVAERVLATRAEARAVLAGRWPAAFVAALMTQAVVFAILLIALRGVGLDAEALPWEEVLLAHALVILVTSVPITPGSVGIAELAYVSILSALAGSGLADAITAGVILFRLATWLLPIPIGWVLALWWKSRSGRDLFALPAADAGGGS